MVAMAVEALIRIIATTCFALISVFFWSSWTFSCCQRGNFKLRIFRQQINANV
jgi:hypothetical protein